MLSTAAEALNLSIPPLANKCPRQSAQKGLLFFDDCGGFFSLTLARKSGKVIKINERDDET